MPTYDILVLIVLLLTTCLGAWKGFVWQIASLASLFASYLVAYKFRLVVAAWLPIVAPFNTLVAMLLLYAACSMTIWFAFHQVRKLIDRVKLKEFDSQLGALFGLAKGILICAIVTLFAIALLGDRQREAIVSSYSGGWIVSCLDRLESVIPAELHELMEPLLQRVDERLEQGETARRSDARWQPPDGICWRPSTARQTALVPRLGA